MKQVLLALILISPITYADWGDTYFCVMTHHSIVTNEGKQTNYILENFKFQMNAKQRVFIFGESGYFKGTIMPISVFVSELEIYQSKDESSHFQLEKGKVIYTVFSGVYSRVLTADCDKFD